MDDVEKFIEQETLSILNASYEFNQKLSGIPTLVNLCDVVQCQGSNLDDLSTNSLNSREFDLSAAVNELERLNRGAKVEISNERSTITALTSLITSKFHTTTEEALECLAQVGSAIPRRVCQFPFKRNDIVWVCRTCQADETCVLCHACYKQSNHEGHDVAFYHAQAGGCCDCGDPDAWDPAGFCPHHGVKAAKESLPPYTVRTVQVVVKTVAQWLVESLCQQTQQAHLRTAGESVSSERRKFDDQLNLSINQILSARRINTVPRELVFCSEAASMSKSRGDQPPQSGAFKSLQLGELARKEHGIYLILHADDIHTKQEVLHSLRKLLGGSNYYADSLMNKLVTALQTHGQIVVWGTFEVLSDLTSSQRMLWIDGDTDAMTRFGAAMFDRVKNLDGLTTSVSTRRELMNEQRAVAVLEWLTALARSCDPLCQTVAESILPEPHLVPMLRADLLLLSRLTKAWHSLLLTLLAVPTFKSHLAAAYCDTYRHVTSQYAHGMGVLERSGYTLSVQFLNRVTYVVDLVQHRDLLGKLGKALYETLEVAQSLSNGRKRLDPNHFVLTHRRYSPCVSDLKCVLNVKGMARLFSAKGGSFRGDWLASLALTQWMDGQEWRTPREGHVETEPRGWVGAFNASISLGSLFERLLSWDDDDLSPAPNSSLSSQVPTIVEFTKDCLSQGIVPWQNQEMHQYQATSNTKTLEGYSKSPASLPYATVHTGETLAHGALASAFATPWSFHLPLHRFFAACLREVCRRPDGMTQLLQQVMHVPMEFPLLVLSRAAQVRAGLWKRNGSLMYDQVLNYAEPPFCRALRDADVLLVQYASLTGGTGSTISLLIHRFGIFEFCGLAEAPSANLDLYVSQLASGLYPREKSPPEDEVTDAHITKPWSYGATKDVSSLLALLEELLQLLIILITELPPIPPVNKLEHTIQAKKRLRREVIHRLASGPKTHSELAEVHHVLSNWDNIFLSEEGKVVNPDDATGAALGATLIEVAEQKSVRGKLEPNQWVLKEEVWDDYDPAFYHISLRNHQLAAESRPNAKINSKKNYGVEPKPLAPTMPYAPHPCFARLRRDITCDATVLAILYRTLHMHCRKRKNPESFDGLRAKLAYLSGALSETALARAVHLLTLGAFAWENATGNDEQWCEHGGNFEGSVFYRRSLNLPSPSVSAWISEAILAEPSLLVDCEWYKGEDNILLLLKRLATDGGSKSIGFIAQDQSVRAGAAWLCEFAAKYNVEAARIIGTTQKQSRCNEISDSEESEIDRKRREAKARAMERMNAQAARFAAMMQIDTEESEEEIDTAKVKSKETTAVIQGVGESADTQNLANGNSFGSSENTCTPILSNENYCTPVVGHTPPFTSKDPFTSISDKCIPPRLLKSRPVCIICNEDTTGAVRNPDSRSGDDGNRKRSRRKTDRSNALAFVGYAQPSTVLKGGGGVPPMNENTTSSAAKRFVGVHIALCGHAIHSECCDSYLASVSNREDRMVGRREEFKCPLCQRLSNCLVPFIDVGVDWIDNTYKKSGIQDSIKTDYQSEDKTSILRNTELKFQTPLHDFLSNTPWWIGRNDTSVYWDGQSAFVVALPAPSDGIEEADMLQNSNSLPKQKRRSVRSLRKKDLYAAWNAMMRTPRFIRRRQPQRSQGVTKPSDSLETTTQSCISTNSIVNMQRSDDTNTGETWVWRRFMDLVSEISYRADCKRLGEENFLSYCGEFRHYHAEKHAYNALNRAAGRENADWPACTSTSPLTENRRQELSREKLLSKLLTTIQSFTYSCCSEINEIKRLLQKKDTVEVDLALMQSIHSKFGIMSLVSDENLVIMPAPSAKDEEGIQPFDGRLGKLRYLGLAVMAAAGAVAADLVQLVFDFPLTRVKGAGRSITPRQAALEHRCPVVFPILLGHVLTHVVAAICATCGRARARSDSLEIVWPAPFSKRGSFYANNQDTVKEKNESVMQDCAGFMKLGLVARVLQVMLGKLCIYPGYADTRRCSNVLQSVQYLLSQEGMAESESAKWSRGCCFLVQAALSGDSKNKPNQTESMHYPDIVSQFHEACKAAVDAAISYLSNIGAIYQILLPGAVMDRDRKGYPRLDAGEYHSLTTLNKLISDLYIEHLDEMIKSAHVCDIVANWFKNAWDHIDKSEMEQSNNTPQGNIKSKLFRTEGFRVVDWPLESWKLKRPEDFVSEGKLQVTDSTLSDEAQNTSFPVEICSPHSQIKAARIENFSASRSFVSFSPRKSVNLLGESAHKIEIGTPQIHMLPTSYTDLYAELGVLCPDSEQTALCLICGTVLNANGKSECTKHSIKCGAGSCIFFLLQECQGLIIHNGKAVYVQSPYVDSHGETPQYRGRPLNLDLDRYDIFRELWTGHGIRQKVVQERGNARQVIITDFY